MKLKGREKVFWWHFRHITHSEDIPKELQGFTSIDSGVDDDFLDMLTSKITSIPEIYLKDTHVTDDGLKYLSRIRDLRELTLIKHSEITAGCFRHLIHLNTLEYLNVSKTQITLDDLQLLAPLRNLKELYVSSENTQIEYVLEHVIRMKEILPGCVLYINYENYE